MPQVNPNPVQTYVVAVRRDRRKRAPSDWIDRVRRCEGVTVQEPVTPRRILVHASARGAAAIREGLSDFLHIEQLIRHEIA